MTRDISRSQTSAQPRLAGDADLLASLWAEAPVARLPVDAPDELRDLVQDVVNPRKVYAIHRASRRHNFQLLIERFIIQLRRGCEDERCPTPTCLTYRARNAGKAPIRRYNTTSARTLAVYLASRDDPEKGLCPFIRSPKEAPASLNALAFTPTRPGRPSNCRSNSRRSTITYQNTPCRSSKKNGAGSPGASPTGDDTEPLVASSSRRGSNGSHEDHKKSTGTQDDGQPTSDDDDIRIHSGDRERRVPFVVTEHLVSKDHRSFTANVFGSVAFKMLEWLTPVGVATMAQKADALDPAKPKNEDEPGGGVELAIKSLDSLNASLDGDKLEASESPEDTAKNTEDQRHEDVSTLPSSSASTSRSSSSIDADKPRRNSNARLRTTAKSTMTRELPIDPLSPAPPYSTEPSTAATSPRFPGPGTDKVARPKNTKAKSRKSSDLNTDPPFLDTVNPPRDIPIVEKPKAWHIYDEGPRSPNVTVPGEARAPGGHCASKKNTPTAVGERESSSTVPKREDSEWIPQALSKLNIEVIDFLSDTLQDDGTADPYVTESSDINHEDVDLISKVPRLRRSKCTNDGAYPSHLKQQWRLFIQQSLFSILSDPHKLISSFVKDGELIDSHSLWYCMLRLSRVAPELVFHSLWMASASLFGASDVLRSNQSSVGNKAYKKPEKPLTNTQAGQLMSICLHALMAAAPLVKDLRALTYLSQLRGSGLATAGPSAGGRAPSWLCLKYNDVFSDELLLRLAKRLFSALSTRRSFAEMVPATGSTRSEIEDLRPLLEQFELLSIDMTASLEFSKDARRVHETRAPLLLFDWAKSVVLQEWNGEPEFPRNGPFSGAVAFMSVMFERRRSLILSDQLFRIDYIGERLDDRAMAVEWLMRDTSESISHLMDFPFLHTTSQLVLWFRSINFVRMNRAYEEAHSLDTRMNAIVARRGLVHKDDHKHVLKEALQTARSKYLVLEISRQHVIRDTFDQLWGREIRELLRPLKLRLGQDLGEEGFDSGGVQQEFLRLAMAECLHPDFGAFTVDERTRMTWFMPGSVVPTWQFELIGLLFSLAVYNGLTLPVTFPQALYRKLLGQPVDTLRHIDDGWGDLVDGFKTLLDWDEAQGAVEDVFMRTYEFSVSMFDETVSREMFAESEPWPQVRDPSSGSLITSQVLAAGNPQNARDVTGDNSEEFVSDYIRYLTDVSVRPQYEAFARGFHTCFHPKSLTLLSPTLLQSITEGVQDISISELKSCTKYIGWLGDERHHTIRDFWSIVKRYDLSMKRKLLEFVTASDRIPVGGMKHVQFTIQKNGEEGSTKGRLPTSYTCYGILLLPEYPTKDVLRDRLTTALNNAQGFGNA